jgi:hypothetical protein
MPSLAQSDDRFHDLTERNTELIGHCLFQSNAPAVMARQLGFAIGLAAHFDIAQFLCSQYALDMF